MTKFDEIVKRLILLTLSIFGSFSLADVDRVHWVESTYERLPHLLRAAKTSGSIEDKEVLEFLKVIESFYSAEKKPPLVFVDDSNKFIIHPGEKPRLMRAPEGYETEIFVNEELLSSDNLDVSLLQLIKFFLHELGHKTELADVETRDRWAQQIEDYFFPYFFRVNNDSGSMVEMLSLPKDQIQRPFSEQPFMIQPTFLIFVHDAQSVRDLTGDVQGKVTEKSMLIRNLSSDLNLALSEMANVVKDAFANELAPFMDQIIGGLAKAVGIEMGDGMQAAFEKFDGRYQHLSALGIHKVSHFDKTIILEGHLDFFHSHANTTSMGLKGLPFAQEQTQPLRVMISLTDIEPQFQVQASLELDTSQVAKVKSVRRSNSKVVYLEVELEWPEQPYSTELVLNFDRGSVRVKSTGLTALGSDRYKIKFELSDPSASLGEQTYSVVVDDQKVIPLEHEVELGSGPPSSRAGEVLNVDGSSFGVWGYRGATLSKEGTFSHLESPILSPYQISNEKQFVIVPQQFWVEFEVEEGAEVAGAELYVNVEQYILDIREKNKEGELTGKLMNSFEVWETVGAKSKRQRYTDAGTVIESKVIKMSLNLLLEHMVISPGSQPGLQKVRIPTATPIPHIRDLRESWEAHRLPAFNPHNLLITTMDGRSYVHNFRPEIDPTEFTETHPLCLGLMSKKHDSSKSTDSK